MNSLFEYSDKLNAPYECFIFDANAENFPIQPHWHYFMEIIYMLEGTAIMNCDEESYTAQPGDMVLFLPNQVHSIYAVANMSLKYYVLKFDLGQLTSSAQGSGASKMIIHFPSMIRLAKNNTSATRFFPRDSMKDFNVKELFLRACAEMEKQEYGYWLMMQSYLTTLLMFVLRHWRENGFDTDQTIGHAPEEGDILYITEYIDSHIQETLKVEELAKMCNMSYSYFAKNFREIYGQSCKKYIEFIRLCKAEELLLFTCQDMSYISQETGFSDCSHFIKTFKEKHGVTPKKYREEHIKAL